MYDCKYVEQVGVVGVRVTKDCPKRRKIKDQLITPKRMCENCEDYRPKLIKCSKCEYSKMEREKKTGKYGFRCDHPDQNYIIWYCKHRKIQKVQGANFIGYSTDGSVPLKTTPHWCPKKQ